MQEHQQHAGRIDAVRRRILTAAFIAGNVKAVKIEATDASERIVLTVYRSDSVDREEMSITETERLPLSALTERLAGQCGMGSEREHDGSFLYR